MKGFSAESRKMQRLRDRAQRNKLMKRNLVLYLLILFLREKDSKILVLKRDIFRESVQQQMTPSLSMNALAWAAS